MTLLDRIVERIGETKSLDAPSKTLVSATNAVVPSGAVTDLLSGKQLGHPAHPMLVTVPIGTFVSASLLDASRKDGAEAMAQRLIAAGLLSAVPTALAGLSDWRYTTGPERRVGLAHAVINTAALGTYAASLVARRKGHTFVGKMLALTGGSIMGAAGALGGHLSYALGVGVDVNVFEEKTQDWVAVADESALDDDSMITAEVNGQPVLLINANGKIRAIGNTCSHRGGPLNEGSRKGSCVECPWHQSEFNLFTGEVEKGPAVRPQPVFEVRVREGKVEIRG